MRKLVFALAIALPLTASAGSKIKAGDAFPSFNVKELGKDSKVSMAKLKGKVVVLDFWASWCEPCKKEIPALNKIYGKYKSRGLSIVGINVDDAENTAQDFLKENKV